MAPVPPPDSLLAVRLPHAEAWCRPEARGRVEAMLEDGKTLHEAARTWARAQGGMELSGRGPVHVVSPEGGPRWAVRHYVRGGLLGPLLEDRYWRRTGTPRPFREARASELVRKRGIRTPPVVAAAVYPSGPFYRGDLVTAYVEGARDLADLLFGDARGDPPVRVALLRGAGAFTGALARAKVHHRDLNAKNLIAAGAEGEGAELHVLDLDRVTVGRASAARSGGRMLRRLQRSLRKWEERTGRRLEEREWEALEVGFREEIRDGADGPSRTR